MGAEVSGAAFQEGNLWRAVLLEADLLGANGTGLVVRCAKLTGANLSAANLLRADFSGSVLRETDLRRANLQGADFRGATLDQCDLRGAHLHGLDLTDARVLRTLTDMEQIQLLLESSLAGTRRAAALHLAERAVHAPSPTLRPLIRVLRRLITGRRPETTGLRLLYSEVLNLLVPAMDARSSLPLPSAAPTVEEALRKLPIPARPVEHHRETLPRPHSDE